MSAEGACHHRPSVSQPPPRCLALTPDAQTSNTCTARCVRTYTARQRERFLSHLTCDSRKQQACLPLPSRHGPCNCQSAVATEAPWLQMPRCSRDQYPTDSPRRLGWAGRGLRFAIQRGKANKQRSRATCATGEGTCGVRFAVPSTFPLSAKASNFASSSAHNYFKLIDLLLHIATPPTGRAR